MLALSVGCFLTREVKQPAPPSQSFWPQRHIWLLWYGLNNWCDLKLCSKYVDEAQSYPAGTLIQPWLHNFNTILSFSHFWMIFFAPLTPHFLCPNILPNKKKVPNDFFLICTSFATATPKFAVSNVAAWGISALQVLLIVYRCCWPCKTLLLQCSPVLPSNYLWGSFVSHIPCP